MRHLTQSHPAPIFSLLNLFSQYYQQVGKIKACMLSNKPSEQLANLTKYTGEMSDTDQADIISEYLKRILLAQREDLQKYALTRELDAYKKSLYAMVALTDEIFLLELKWKGQDDFFVKNLEQQLFASTSAGEDLFTEIDNLLENKNRNKLTCELASIYLLTLRLGFKGIHRDDQDDALLQYRSKLYRLAGNSDVFNGESKLFGAAYDYLLNPTTKYKLPPLSHWHRIAIAALSIYLGASYLVWRISVNPLYEITKGTFGG